MSSSRTSTKKITVKDVQNYLKSQKNYNAIQILKLQITQNDESLTLILIDAIDQILTDQVSEPIQKLLSIRLAKELADMHSCGIIQMIEKNVLNHLYTISTFDCKNHDPDRGKLLLSNEPSREEQQIGNSILRLALECIFVWAIWFPQGQNNMPSQFVNVKQKLQEQGVHFPKLNFFNANEVKQVFFSKNPNICISIPQNNDQPATVQLSVSKEARKFSSQDPINLSKIQTQNINDENDNNNKSGFFSDNDRLPFNQIQSPQNSQSMKKKKNQEQFFEIQEEKNKQITNLTSLKIKLLEQVQEQKREIIILQSNLRLLKQKSTENQSNQHELLKPSKGIQIQRNIQEDDK